MEIMEDYYGKEVMVFIDEYDTPFVEAHTGGFYDEVRGGLAGLLHNSLKTSTSLKYAMLTEIQRVAKENIFSDLNNLDVYTVIDNDYSEYFGFSIEETKELLEYYDLELNDEVKEMYDGYHIGNQDIYNPWSITNYLDKKKIGAYWAATSSNTLINSLIQQSATDMKEKMKWNDYDSLPLILDVTDIQGIMGISRASAYELVHTPGFPVVRSGRLIKISKKAFFNWLDSGGNSHENEKEKTA